MPKKDLFYQSIEGRMEDLKQKPITEEKESLGQKIQKRFIILLGLVILLGLLFSLLSLLR